MSEWELIQAAVLWFVFCASGDADRALFAPSMLMFLIHGRVLVNSSDFPPFMNDFTSI